jgi:molecular chaperone GrpE
MMSADERDDSESGEESAPEVSGESSTHEGDSDGQNEAPGGASEGAAASADAQDAAADAVGSDEKDADPEPEPDPLAELQSRYDEAQARLRTVSKAYRDLQGEMHAFRERMEARAKMESERQAFDQARRFFDPVMNLKRSLAQQTSDIDALRSGLEMVQHQFMEAMEKLGLEEVPGEGASFDPNVHEALAVTPVTDEAQDGKVLMVHTTGFTVKGKVLQAAQVVIGKYQADAGDA